MRPAPALANRTDGAFGNPECGGDCFEFFSARAGFSNLMDLIFGKLCLRMAFALEVILVEIARSASSYFLGILPSPMAISKIGSQTISVRVLHVSPLIAPLKIARSIVLLVAVKVIDMWKAFFVVDKCHCNQTMDKQAFGTPIFCQRYLLIASPSICAEREFSRGKTNAPIARDAKRWESFNRDGQPCFHHSSLASAREN